MSVKRYRVILEDEAIADLAAIRDYIAQRAPDTATEFIDYLLDEIYKLELLPFGHQVERKPSPRLPFTLRRLPVSGYRVLYTVVEDQPVVRVLGVQHGSRNRWP